MQRRVNSKATARSPAGAGGEPRMATAPHRLRARVEAAAASLVAVHPHEIQPLMSAASTFFFILSAYFVVLPLRDEGAISLGLGTLPGLFAGSLILTVLAAPVASLAFSLPSIPKPRVFQLISSSILRSLVCLYTWSIPTCLPVK